MNATALGLLVGSRASVGTYATVLGILGREVYNLDGAEPRKVIVVPGRLVNVVR